jgi:hypothetical protein
MANWIVMPSDPRHAAVVPLLAASWGRYRSAVAATLEEVRGQLAASRTDADGRARQLAAELGRFAIGRIDVTRLLDVLDDREALDPAALPRLEAALETLREIARRHEDLFHVSVPPGGDLTAALRARLADVGRAFGAARVAGAARRGLATAEPGDHRALAGFDFAHWNGAERRLAPPVVVSVEGGDLQPGGLAAFLDGSQHIVLIVEGRCAPAPLVRLITPGTLVIQAQEPAGLAPLAGWSGPAIAALVPASAADFIHDPLGGTEPWRRLRIRHAPKAPRGRVGRFSVEQQSEELQQLATLARQPAPADTTAVPAAPPDPADRLAAWLLKQADLSEPH